ncbi:MAG: hypothetical protein N2234_09305 [Planctomycetota bacterium]|nr:hypothetical protein [Planctomycetota bacterium]
MKHRLFALFSFLVLWLFAFLSLGERASTSEKTVRFYERLKDGKVLLYTVKSRVERFELLPKAKKETISEEENLCAVAHYSEEKEWKSALMFQRLSKKILLCRYNDEDKTDYLAKTEGEKPLPGFFFLKRAEGGGFSIRMREADLSHLLIIPYCCRASFEGEYGIGEKQRGRLDFGAAKAEYEWTLEDFYEEKGKQVAILAGRIHFETANGSGKGVATSRLMMIPDTGTILKEKTVVTVKLEGLVYRETYESHLLSIEEQEPEKLSSQMKKLEAAYAALSTDHPVELLQLLDEAFSAYENGLFAPYIERLFSAARKRVEHLYKELLMDELQKKLDELLKKHKHWG